MKAKKKKQKKTKLGNKDYHCEVQHISYSEAEYIDAWKIYVKKERIFLNALLRKRDLEQQLSSVRIEIIDMCIDSARRGLANGNKKLKDATNPFNIKTAKRKRK